MITWSYRAFSKAAGIAGVLLAKDLPAWLMDLL
jgi:hypothetical protein